jgi:YhcH/YjgK/YiaL family protein
MIFDHVHNSHLYANLNEKFQHALAHLNSTDFLTMPVGKYEIDGSSIYVIVQGYTTRLESEGKWESHRRYSDIQYMIRGIEKICVAPLSNMEQGDYNDAKDFLALSGQGDYLTFPAGFFMVFFPEDAHRPCMAVAEPMQVKKAVYKIAVD